MWSLGTVRYGDCVALVHHQHKISVSKNKLLEAGLVKRVAERKLQTIFSPSSPAVIGLHVKHYACCPHVIYLTEHERESPNAYLDVLSAGACPVRAEFGLHSGVSDGWSASISLGVFS